MRGATAAKLLRVGLTIVSLVALAIWLPYASLANIIATARLDWFVAAAAVAASLGLLDALRVAILLGLPGKAFVQNLRITFLAALTAQLPTGLIGGDLYRSVALRVLDESTESIVSTLMISRLMSLFAMLVALSVTSALMLSGLTSTPASASGMSTMAVLCAGGVLVSGVLSAGALAYRLPFWRRWSVIRDVLGRIRAVSLHQFGAAMAISIGLVFVRAAALWMAINAIGLNVSLDVAILALSAGFLLSVIPLTAAGIGLREAGIAGVLVLFGVDPGVAVFGAIIFRAVALAGAVAGYVVTQLLEWALVWGQASR